MMLGTLSAPLALPRGAVLPDYGDGGLFGLVRSFRRFLDGQAWSLPGGMDASAAGEGRGARGVVFILVDGLGDDFLLRFGGGGALLAHRVGRLTSVFPSTTASAVTTVLTGLPPAVHGLTGWFIRDRRFGGVVAPLPLRRRLGGAIRGPFAAARLFPYPSLFEDRRRPAELILPRHIAWSPYSRRHARGARMRPYAGLSGMMSAICEAVADRSTAGSFVHAYYPVFDALAHVHGARAEPTVVEFGRIDAAFAGLLDRLKGSGAEIVVSADHGFIDSPPGRFIRLDHRGKELGRMLAGPLFGERRVVFCDVRAGAERDFSAMVRERLAGKAVLVRAADMARHGLFGPGPAHPRLAERTGTHALLMEADWTVSDRLPSERLPRMVGVHGGMSGEEMRVPLVYARC